MREGRSTRGLGKRGQPIATRPPFWPTRLLRPLIASFLAREEVPGASVNVRVGGERAFAVALGTRDLAGMTAQRADDRSLFYSTTRLIRAAALRAEQPLGKRACY
jgi:hypothetical protein